MAKRYYSQSGDRIEEIDPVIVSRYRGFTRANHWVTAASLIVLLLSGMALFSPYLYFLTGLFGGGQTTRWLHPIVGIVLFFSFLILFLQLWRLNLPKPEDVTWVENIAIAQKMNFCPALYLPISGSFSSSPLITSPMFSTQVTSSGLGRFSRQS